jgi:membrane protease YdiL (CAAX protease family)
LIASSFFLAWLTIRAGSFWPAAIAHGAVNSIREGVISDVALTVAPIHKDLVLIALEIGIGLLCWAALKRSRLDSTGSATDTHAP